jgi:hypothetical protein
VRENDEQMAQRKRGIGVPKSNPFDNLDKPPPGDRHDSEDYETVSILLRFPSTAFHK